MIGFIQRWAWGSGSGHNLGSGGEEDVVFDILAYGVFFARFAESSLLSVVDRLMSMQRGLHICFDGDQK